MKRQENRIAFQGGAYSLAITAVVLAILVVINVLAASLPSSLMKYDISSSKLYSITSNTKVVVNALDQDVNIYFPERLARICNDMGVKHFLHVSALQQNLKHRSEWARTKVGAKGGVERQAKGEEVVRATKPETCIVRPADMFGEDDRVLQWWD